MSQAQTERFHQLRYVKMGIYIAVVTYASYVIIFGTTFFNEFQRMMIFGMELTAITGFLFIYLGLQMKKYPKKLEN
ncbi:hypothetical protein [Nitrosopumilus sp. S6]